MLVIHGNTWKPLKEWSQTRLKMYLPNEFANHLIYVKPRFGINSPQGLISIKPNLTKTNLTKPN